jgi:type II secretory pathway predicted ATPase ExeA
MYESYYGLVEKPFSLTPDPKFLYRSESHANAFELLQYAIDRREGFAVVTGDIGTGKTTLCRALLERINRTTFSALVLNPFLSEDDLLKRILQDFGVISPDDVRQGRLVHASKPELVDALYDFLLGLIPQNASAVLIIDEAQNLPLPVLEQIRILSNLETDKEKLLQIILVGQSNLKALLRSPELRQLDQRVSIRYELKPLDRENVGAYVAHRLAVAGGAAGVAFTTKALDLVHRLSGGIPRLINLICDRALLAGYSERANRIGPNLILHAARSLDLQLSAGRRLGWLPRRASLLAGVGVVLMGSAIAVGGTALVYLRFTGTLQASEAVVEDAATTAAELPPAAPQLPPAARPLPADAGFTILVGSYAEADPDLASMTGWLEASGFDVFQAAVDAPPAGRRRQLLAGAYTDPDAAQADLDRLKRAAPALDVRIVSTGPAAHPAAGDPDAPGPAEQDP